MKDNIQISSSVMVEAGDIQGSFKHLWWLGKSNLTF